MTLDVDYFLCWFGELYTDVHSSEKLSLYFSFSFYYKCCHLFICTPITRTIQVLFCDWTWKGCTVKIKLRRLQLSHMMLLNHSLLCPLPLPQRICIFWRWTHLFQTFSINFFSLFACTWVWLEWVFFLVNIPGKDSALPFLQSVPLSAQNCSQLAAAL